MSDLIEEPSPAPQPEPSPMFASPHIIPGSANLDGRSRSSALPWVIVGLLVFAVVVFAGWTQWQSHQKQVALAEAAAYKLAHTKTVTGTFTLSDSDTWKSECKGQGGYSDIDQGAPVILYNESGKILSSTTLGAGTKGPAIIPPGDLFPDGLGTQCTYSFTLTGVPDDQQQYALEITHRGKLVNSRSEMDGNGWTFAASLGS